MKSFAQLQKASAVSAEELVATLKDYAEGGWAISGRVVVGIIDRTWSSLSDEDKANLRKYAETGMKIQRDRHFTKEVAEYEQVLAHLS